MCLFVFLHLRSPERCTGSAGVHPQDVCGLKPRQRQDHLLSLHLCHGHWEHPLCVCSCQRHHPTAQSQRVQSGVRAYVRRTSPPHCTNAHLYRRVRSTPHASHSTPCRLTYTHTPPTGPFLFFFLFLFLSTVHSQILLTANAVPPLLLSSSPLPPSLGSLLCQSPCSFQSCSPCQIWPWLLALAHFIWHTNILHRLYSDRRVLWCLCVGYVCMYYGQHWLARSCVLVNSSINPPLALRSLPLVAWDHVVSELLSMWKEMNSVPPETNQGPRKQRHSSWDRVIRTASEVAHEKQGGGDEDSVHTSHLWMYTPVQDRNCKKRKKKEIYIMK